MADWQPEGWTPFAKVMYAIGALYLVGFFAFFARFQVLGRKARAGDAAAVARYNRSLKGFPNAFYAKLLGRRPLESADGETGSETGPKDGGRTVK